MISYTIPEKNKLIFHFGQGLVGSAIEKSILNNGAFAIKKKHHQHTWEDNATNISRINAYLEEECNNSIQDIQFIWSAGKCGFSATEAETSIELAFFGNIFNQISHFIKKYNAAKTSFHLISSAGGLFEKSRLTKINDEPQIARPYGHLKKNQEAIVLASKAFKHKHIYRLSSVYSNHNLSGRLGLITTLIKNGIQHKVSKITGSENTLRDYILDDDIANFIRNIILFDLPANEINFVVSGKASSLMEIRRKIENMINQKLYLQYSLNKSNSRDICFSKDTVPKELEISPLETNMKILFNNIIKQDI